MRVLFVKMSGLVGVRSVGRFRRRLSLRSSAFCENAIEQQRNGRHRCPSSVEFGEGRQRRGQLGSRLHSYLLFITINLEISH